jgi:hypothetical protein
MLTPVSLLRMATKWNLIQPVNRSLWNICLSNQQQLTFCNELSIVEKLTYEPHPSETNTTLLKQEAVITVHGIPLSSYFEDFLSSTISVNANKGRQAMEWVISKINAEVEEMKNTVVVKSVDELIHTRRNSQEEAAFTS